MTTARPTAPPDVSAPEDDAPIPGRTKWSATKARRFLESCPKEWITVERSDDDRKFETETGRPTYQVVIWNGWRVMVPKGKSVEVPAPIAEILEQSAQIFRTDQAREAQAFFNDIGEGLGIELPGL